jgi:uncharacterized protein CbrC (UPF0167 family)
MNHDELRATAEKYQANSTHFQNCYKYHGWCAVSRLLDELDAKKHRIYNIGFKRGRRAKCVTCWQDRGHLEQCIHCGELDQ